MILKEDLKTLKKSVEDWKTRFLLQSPVAGKVYFTIPLQENQLVGQDRLIGFIYPNENFYYAETHLPQNNFAKIDTGLTVQLRFIAFPYREFGSVQGILNFISPLASDSGFMATIRLNESQVNSKYKPILLRDGLKAQAIIVIQNMPLLKRIFYNLFGSTTAVSK